MQLRIRAEAEKRLMGNDELIQNVPDYLDEFTLTAHLARDIECQWNLFLINT